MLPQGFGQLGGEHVAARCAGGEGGRVGVGGGHDDGFGAGDLDAVAVECGGDDVVLGGAGDGRAVGGGGAGAAEDGLGSGGHFHDGGCAVGFVDHGREEGAAGGEVGFGVDPLEELLVVDAGTAAVGAVVFPFGRVFFVFDGAFDDIVLFVRFEDVFVLVRLMVDGS